MSIFSFLKKKEEPVLRAEIGEGITPAPFLPTAKKPIQDYLKKKVVKPSKVPEPTIWKGNLPDFIKHSFEKEREKERIFDWWIKKEPERYREIIIEYPAEHITSEGRAKLVNENKITPEEAEYLSAIPEYTPVMTGMKKVGAEDFIKMVQKASEYKSASRFAKATAKKFGMKAEEFNTAIKKDFGIPSLEKLWEYATGKTNALTVPKTAETAVGKVIKPFAKKGTSSFTENVAKKAAKTATTKLSLAEEAQKYDSAKEFVKNQLSIYHGTSENFDTIKSMRQLRKEGSNIESSNIAGNSPFIHFTENANTAEQYAQTRAKNMGGKPKVLKYKMIGNILDLSKHPANYSKSQKETFRELSESLSNKGADGAIKGALYKLSLKNTIDVGKAKIGFQQVEQLKKFPELLKEKGYVGFKFIDNKIGGGYENTVAAIPDKIFTVEQLKDIYNQAKKEGNIPNLPKPPKPKVEKGFFSGLKFKEPTIAKYLTPQTYYSQVLGLKPLVKPLELAKQRFDLSFRKMSNGVDKIIKTINKVSDTSLTEKALSKLKNKSTKAVKEMRNLLDKYEEAPKSLSPEKTEIFNWFRGLNKEMLNAENAVREELGIDPIKYRKAYVRHVADDAAKEMLEGLYPFPPELSYWSDKVVGKKIFNPMEMQRKLSDDLQELWTKDLAQATKSMIWTALKEINLSKPLDTFTHRLGLINKDESVYENLSPEDKKFFSGVQAMPSATKKWLIDYVNQVIKGHETNLDRSVNNIVTQTGLKGLFNKILKPFGRVVGKTPVTHMEQTAGRALIHGVLGPLRPKLLLRNKMQSTQNLALYTLKSNMKGFLPSSAEKNLQELLDKSLFLKTYTGVEELPVSLQGKLEKANLAGFQLTAKTNAKRAMKVAYWDTKDLIVNQKYKKYGWADPARTYQESKDFLYPSEKEKILKEMEFGASATQYHYIPMSMPEVFRHKALTPLTRLQSWWMNHFFKFHREAIMRGYKGETGYGSKIPWSRRLGWLRYIILGGLVLNTMGYERSYLLGAAPTGLPPTAQMAIGMYTYLTTLDKFDEPWAKKKNEEAKRKMYYSIKTFMPGYLSYKDFKGLWSGEKSLKDYFFYTKYKKAKSKKMDLNLDLDIDTDLDLEL